MAPAPVLADLVQWSWVSSERALIVHLLLQHLELTVIAVTVGLAISTLLAALAWAVPHLRGLVVGTCGALYVVPSVAVMFLVAPLTGYFSVTTAEVVLVSYTLLILVRNIVAGLQSVPDAALEAARGMGYTRPEQMRKVRLPLAMPSIMGGIRVAAVTVIGLVNVTAFVNQGGLGQLIIQQGFEGNFDTAIVVGLVLSVVLAGVADAALVALEWAALPWLRSQRKAERA